VFSRDEMGVIRSMGMDASLLAENAERIVRMDHSLLWLVVLCNCRCVRKAEAFYFFRWQIFRAAGALSHLHGTTVTI
jgi:hypothetical protein